MKGLTKENVKQAYQSLKEIEQKELDGKMMVIRFYYACVILALIVVCGVILIKG